jgi:hypothetical protein
MKKAILLLILAAGTCGVARAFEFGNDRAYDKVHLRYKVALTANLSTTTLLVDLSDNVNWPHKRKGEIHLYNVRITADKVSTATVTVQLGVVNYVGPSTGSVTWVVCLPNAKNVSNTNNTVFLQSDLVYNLRVKASTTSIDRDGSTPYLISNDVTSGTGIYNSSTTIPTANLAVPLDTPEAGDLVAYFQNGATATDFYIELDYATEN